jgi:hypothetical protein
MPRILPRLMIVPALFSVLILAGCVDPRLNAGISIGANGASITPSISGGIPGAGRLTYAP